MVVCLDDSPVVDMLVTNQGSNFVPPAKVVKEVFRFRQGILVDLQGCDLIVPTNAKIPPFFRNWNYWCTPITMVDLFSNSLRF